MLLSMTLRHWTNLNNLSKKGLTYVKASKLIPFGLKINKIMVDIIEIIRPIKKAIGT